MRKLVSYLGMTWMAVFVAVGVWLGFSETFLAAPGIIFRSGFGDIWLLGAAALPGYMLWNWGRSDA